MTGGWAAASEDVHRGDAPAMPHYGAGTKTRLEVTVEHRRQHAPADVVPLPSCQPEMKMN